MKRFSILFLIGILATACQRDGYVIEGTAPGVHNGIRAYVRSFEGRTQVNVDTSIVMNEKFAFKGKVKQPGLYYLTVDNIIGSIPLVIENNEKFEIEINNKKLSESKVTGSEATKVLNDINSAINEKIEEIRTIGNEQRKAVFANDTATVKALTKKINQKQDSIQLYGFSLLKEHSNSITSLILLEQQSKNPRLNIEAFLEAFNNLSPSLKNSEKGKKLQVTINQLKIKQEKINALEVGKPAPKFTAPNPDGKDVALYDVLGKYTIIDFWAAWCRPCREENSNVVKLYEKYNKQGLSIIGVSLDRNGQKDQWLKAIEDDKLNWHHVSNLNYFNCPVAQLYNIQSIPATYLLDEKGTIIAKNLRGNALKQKLEALFGN